MQVSRKPSNKGRWSTLGGARCPVRAEAHLAQGPLAPCVGVALANCGRRADRFGAHVSWVASGSELHPVNRMIRLAVGNARLLLFTLFRPSEMFMCFQHVVLRWPNSFLNRLEGCLFLPPPETIRPETPEPEPG